ncbi:MAG: hypothetical protein AAF478_06375 [Pseudomonadota bacterium]
MENTTPIVFIGLAFIIILIAILLTWLLRRTIAKDRRLEDPNGDPRDSDGVATWTGVDHDH